ncbi:YfhO family protein [Streptomyces solicathayae]|uniref:YfhO family protein n=1 Tax=Streptomyces solicathayae TaxID=3081768 RepID=A0ABZ0LYW6_9ACTN|nr:YfhO family protein [Streptomyces sp. HUAS YS2]WOX23969.1 YfhO family protein [Streptomyces sp. HUAS YS2]
MRRPSLPARPAAAPALAGLLAALALCAGDAAARTFPFGSRTRAVNDLGNQFVPFHAQLWDLLHGRADGGLLLNWRSGWGTSFLPDLGTYLTSPFALLVGLFPRDGIDLAVYVITVLKTATAAAAMAGVLLALRPGPRWGAAVLGASYGLCGWSVVEATYNPMWLDGLIAFPLLCLVGEWVRERRRPVLGPGVVALAWVANFYTAYMATLGAALVLLVRLAAARELRPGVVARAAGTVALGVGLAAPVLLPVFLGSRHAYPGVTREFVPATLPDVLARTLPATYGFASPAAFLGTGALLLACGLAFRRDVPGRERWLWTGLAVAVALSLQWQPTHLVWHVFATPNGSPYRQSFVLAGVLVLTAWAGLSYGWPDRRSLLGGAAVVLVLAAGATGSALVSVWTYPLFAAGFVASAAGLVLARRHGGGRYGDRRYAVLAAGLLAAALVGQAAATTAYADREKRARLDDYPAWGAAHETRAAAVAAADGWPVYRTDPGRPLLTGNDPLLVGGQGAGYYSSHTPEVLTRTLAALGAGWTSRGRNLQSLDNPVTDALFGVGARWRDGRVVRTGEPLPLVTVRPAGPPGAYGPSAFRNQELLLGARVYDLPADGVCPVGTEVFLWAPDFTGTARLGAAGPPVELRGGLPKRRAAMTSLGVQGTAGAGPVLEGRGGRGAVGCLDPARLRAAVTALRARAATEVEITDSGVRAELPPGVAGTVVVAAPRIAGWRCDGRPATAYGGLLAAPATGRTTTICTFRPPGLRGGLGVGAVALALVARVVGARRRTRTGAAATTGC